MNINELKIAAKQSETEKLKARARGLGLEERFKELLAKVKPGAEDPLLIELLGQEISELVRKTKWSTLVVNPGSTSTKVSVYSGLVLVADDEVAIDPGLPDGVERRAAGIIEWIRGLGLDFDNLTGIAARGGFVAPVPSGTYAVSKVMLDDLTRAPHRHASNMAVPIAVELGKLAAQELVLTITDPVTCDEIDTVYRITGSPKIRTRGSGAHYLNTRAVCRLVEMLLDAKPSELNIIACHMGGGMSASRYTQGRVVQVLKAFGTIPSANRSGGLPLMEILNLADRKEYTFDDLKGDVVEGKGGLLGLAGTNDFKKFFEFAKGSSDSKQKQKMALLTDFFSGRVASAILELAACEQPIDAIVLTGGLARDPYFCELIARKIPLHTPVIRIPGSVEAQSLAAGLLRAAGNPSSKKNYAEERDKLAARRAEEDALLNTTIFKAATPKIGTCLDTFEKIMTAARSLTEIPTVAIVGGDNEEALLAAKLANQAGARPLARFVLVGSFSKISELAWELDVPIDEELFFIVDAEDAPQKAMELYREGVVDAIMKGNITTAALLKSYLDTMKAMGKLKKGAIISHLGLFELSGKKKLVALSDAAINPNPDIEARVAILDNALCALKALGFKRPKIAVIAPTEKPSSKVVSSIEGEEIAARYKYRTDVIVEGPLAVDLALSPESAREKKYLGQIQGDADMLLVPTLDVGNAVWKSLTVAGGATVAGTVVGCGAPMILTSRGDTAKSKLASIALALVLTKTEGDK